jgi:enterochelin esterase family protein
MVSFRDSIVIIDHRSTVLAANPLGDPAERHLPVYLPPGYHHSPERRYPVIWVLAPFTSWGERFFNLSAWDENIVQRMDRLVRTRKAAPAILAFPDAFTALGGSQYINSPAVGRYRDYLIDELIPLVDSQFRTLPDAAHRGVLGYSSGGYGALVLAMENSDCFSAAASHSGDVLFEACYWPDIPGAIRTFESSGGVEGFIRSLPDIPEMRDRSRDWFSALNIIAMSACYSPNPDSPLRFDLPFDPFTGQIRPGVWARWAAHDPLRLVRDRLSTLRKLKVLYFDCGNHDEYNLWLGARQLDALLDESDIPHIYEEFDGGHFNINWRYDISLPVITRALAQ